MRRLAATALLLATAAPALAGDSARCGERHLELYTGLGLTESSDLELRRPETGLDVTVRDVTWEDYSLSAPSAPYVGVRLGCFLTARPALGFTLEFVHYKVFAETDRLVRVDGSIGGEPIDQELRLNRVVQRYDVGNGVNLLLLSVVGRNRLRPGGEFPDGRLSLYAGLGAGPSILYTQSTVVGEERGGYELGRIGLQAKVGVETRINRRWDAFAEYKYTYTRANGSIARGESETRLLTDHFVAGIGFRF